MRLKKSLVGDSLIENGNYKVIFDGREKRPDGEYFIEAEINEELFSVNVTPTSLFGAKVKRVTLEVWKGYKDEVADFGYIPSLRKEDVRAFILALNAIEKEFDLIVPDEEES